MNKKLRTGAIALVLLTSSTMFFTMSKPAQAFFFDPFQTMVQTLLTNMDNSLRTMTTSIGEMADRILVMSDNIGLMADRILVMADKIVSTEQLMAELVGQNGPSTLLLSPTEGSTVSLSSAPVITLSSNSTDYVLYMSNTSDMSAATNVLVLNNNTTDAWSRAASYSTGNKLYLAVKAISGSTMGPISNTVSVNVIP